MARADSGSMTNAAGVAYGELIRRQRRDKKMSQEELGALVRVGKNAVGAWEAGRSRPDVASVPVICQALDLSLEEFFGLEEYDFSAGAARRLLPSDASNLLHRYASLNQYNRRVVMREMEVLYAMQEGAEGASRRVVRLYMNDLAASAGPGEALDAARGEEAYLFADAASEAADEIIRVNGDSMEPTFLHGDYVLVRHEAAVREGEIGIFVIGDSGYIKEYHRDGLYSHNPAYPPILFSEGMDVRCLGRVLGTVKKEDWADDESIRAWKENEEEKR